MHDPVDERDPVARAQSAIVQARELGFDVVLVDTAGRLHIDDVLMQELDAITAGVEPSDRLFVADAMTGQDAVRSAGEFHRRAGVTGIVLTKMDGDARGGAALSIVSVVGVPIVFSGVGERLEDLEVFRPDRLVSRMLGLGDILTLVERAEEAAARNESARVEQKRGRDQFTLEDLREQLNTLRRMGPLDQLVGMIPGMTRQADALGDVDQGQLLRMAAIIDSMTSQERRRPVLINGGRRKRIARGSGTTVEEVNRLLKQFMQMRKMLKTVAGMGRTGKQRRGAGPSGILGSGQMLN